MLGGRIATMAISFLAMLYIARNLGPTNFGQLSYALSVVGLIGFIAPLGLDGILYRELIRHPERRSELFGTSLILRLVAGSMVAIATIIVAITLTSDDVSRIIIIILSGTFIFNAFQQVNFDFLSRAQSQYQAIISVIVSLVLNILKALTIYLGEGVIYLALILLFESILNAILYLCVYYRKTGDRMSNWKWDSSLAVLLLRDSLPIMFLSGFAIIYARIDQVFIKHILGPAEVGLYDAAVRLVDVWNFIPGALIAALFPAVVNAEKVSEVLLQVRAKKATLLYLFIPIIVAVPTTILASFVVEILYGPAFSASADVLRVYIWSFVGTSLGIHFHGYLIIKNERALLVVSSLIPMLVNIALNLLWIPEFGIMGAAYATVIAYSLVPCFFVFRRRPRGTV